MNIDGTEWMTVVDHNREVNALKEQLKEASAETAAFLQWLETQASWEAFWADGFLGQELVSNATQNLQALRAFMNKKKHGLRFLAQYKVATQEIKDLNTAIDQLIGSLYKLPELMLEAEKKNPAWNKAELWGIERDIVPSLRALIVQAIPENNKAQPERLRDSRQSL